jgi:uncharacterized protein (TIGR02284 family)
MNLSINLSANELFITDNFRQKTISSLNRLIEINNDRCREYRKALDETPDATLKPVFQKYIKQSNAFKNTLTIWIKAYRGEVSHELQNTRTLHRMWVDFKSLFPASDREAILNSCEYIESAAIDRYKKIMASNYLPAEAIEEIRLQKEELSKAYEEIISLSAVDALYKY